MQAGRRGLLRRAAKRHIGASGPRFPSLFYVGREYSRAATHVDSCDGVLPDAGSTPAASTSTHLQLAYGKPKVRSGQPPARRSALERALDPKRVEGRCTSQTLSVCGRIDDDGMVVTCGTSTFFAARTTRCMWARLGTLPPGLRSTTTAKDRLSPRNAARSPWPTQSRIPIANSR